jgi:hypothetical protein
VVWRTKVGRAAPVDHGTRDAANALIDDTHRRYRAGARAFRIVRLYDPDGGVRLIDFEAETKNSARALQDVERATAARDRTIQAATDAWEREITRAVELGETTEDVAAAAGTTTHQVTAILRRRS